MKEKKIGIVTFHNANNYGAVLQNYALQKAICKSGYLPETIDFRTEIIENSYKLWPQMDKGISMKKKVTGAIWRVFNLNKTYKRIRKFNLFRKNYLNLSDAIYQGTIDKYDFSSYEVIISGSDQVWNKDIIKYSFPIYTLGFYNGYKAAYAASAGTEQLDDCILDNVKKYNYVTVRESSLQNFLDEKNISSSIVCDPVFLLDKIEWSRLCGNNNFKKKYIFVYYLGGEREIVRIAMYLSQITGYRIVHPGKFFPKNRKLRSHLYEHGPIEFVNDIAHSEMTIVSSFHGVVFSLIFEKDFYAVLGEKRNRRLIDLLERLGLQDRVITDYEDFLSRKKSIKKIDYDKVNNKIEKMVKYSYDQLVKICEKQVNNEGDQL